MTSSKREIEAGTYVLGLLEGAARDDFEDCLPHDAAMRTEVAAWEQLFAGFEDHSTAPLPAGLWERLAPQLMTPPLRESAEKGLLTVRGDEGTWEDFGPGVEKKHLYFDPRTGLESCLLRLQPGARIAPHQHAMVEECVVLEGDLQIGRQRLRAGDYQVALPGSLHPEIWSERGGTLYVRGITTADRGAADSAAPGP